ncbi:MAG: DUF4199 domain-containing protein [Chlorobi bacterium]|nr:DUF4199 domain-containing protein [Chlorobiota bacterium]
MEENKQSPLMPSLSSGIIVGIALIIFSLIMYFLDVDRESKIMWLSYLILFAGIYWAIVSYRKKLPGEYMTYGQAFVSGFLTGLFTSVLVAVFTYIYIEYIDTTLIDKILAQAEEQILNSQPDISDEDLDRALSISRIFTSPGMLSVFSFFANVVLSTIFSLIIAIFARREDTSVA